MTQDATDILAGAFKPWWFDSTIASADEWKRAAQAALDGEPDELNTLFDQLNEAREEPTYPDCELWRDQFVERVSPAIFQRSAA